MAVELIIEPDVSKVEKAIDELERGMRAKPAVLPISAGGGAPGGAGSRTPTANEVLQSGFFHDPANGWRTTGSWAVTGPQQLGAFTPAGKPAAGAVLGAMPAAGQINIGGQTMAVTNPAWLAAMAAQGVGGAGSPPTPPPPGRRTPPVPPMPPAPPPWWAGGGGLTSSGWGFLGYATAANFATSALSAERQYGVEEFMAGNDPRAQAEAVLGYREKLAGSAGFISRAIAYAQDPTGLGEAGIRAQLLSSELQDRRTARAGANYELKRGAEDRADALSFTNPYLRRSRQIASAGERELRSLAAEQRAVGRMDETAIEADVVADLTANPGQIADYVKAHDRDWRAMSAGDWNKSLDDARATLIGTRKLERMKVRADAAERAVFGPARRGVQSGVDAELRDATRDEVFRLADNRMAADSAIEAAKAIARNDPRAAKIEGIAARGRRDILSAIARSESWADVGRVALANTTEVMAQRAVFAREDEQEIFDLARGGVVGDLLLQHKPTSARALARKNKLYRDLAAGGKTTAEGTSLRRELEGEAAGDVELIYQNDADERRYRRMALEGQQATLYHQLNFRPGSAQAVNAASQAETTAARLRDQDDMAGAGMVLTNAILEQRVLKQQPLANARAAAIGGDPFRVDASATQDRPGENLMQLWQTINQNIADLVRQGGAGAVATD